MSRLPIDVSMLDIKFYCSDLAGDITIRKYLEKLLATLWHEEEGFSGWKHDVIKALILHKHVEGRLDEAGDIETCRGTQVEELMQGLIKLMCEKRK